MDPFNFTIIAALYLIPTLIALLRRHRAPAAIFATNVLLGWTVLGWVIAFIWSLNSNTRAK